MFLNKYRALNLNLLRNSGASAEFLLVVHVFFSKPGEGHKQRQPQFDLQHDTAGGRCGGSRAHVASARRPKRKKSARHYIDCIKCRQSSQRSSRPVRGGEKRRRRTCTAHQGLFSQSHTPRRECFFLRPSSASQFQLEPTTTHIVQNACELTSPILPQPMTPTPRGSSAILRADDDLVAAAGPARNPAWGSTNPEALPTIKAAKAARCKPHMVAIAPRDLEPPGHWVELCRRQRWCLVGTCTDTGGACCCCERGKKARKKKRGLRVGTPTCGVTIFCGDAVETS